MAKQKKSAPRILAVASAGGHWHQLCQVCKAFDEDDLFYVTTMKGLPDKQGFKRSAIVMDCNQNAKLKMMWTALQLLVVFVRVRPNVVVSTGALPGLIAVLFGRLIRARTIWVDSIANVEEPSASGRIAQKFASLWLSQSEHVAKTAGGRHEGALL